MLKTLFGAAILFTAILGCDRNKLESDKDQRSYAIGYTLGQQLKDVKAELEMDVVFKGLKDGANGSGKLEAPVVSKRLNELQMKQLEFEKSAAVDNLKKSQEFIASLGSDKTLRAIEPGLLVKEIKPAPQGSPKRSTAIREDDEIVVRYTAKLADGKVVDQKADSSGFRLKFKDLAVPGLKKALQRMPIGAEWQIYLSPENGFGDSSRPGIPSQSALVYELTLASVIPSGKSAGASQTK